MTKKDYHGVTPVEDNVQHKVSIAIVIGKGTGDLSLRTAQAP